MAQKSQQNIIQTQIEKNLKIVGIISIIIESILIITYYFYASIFYKEVQEYYGNVFRSREEQYNQRFYKCLQINIFLALSIFLNCFVYLKQLFQVAKNLRETIIFQVFLVLCFIVTSILFSHHDKMEKYREQKYSKYQDQEKKDSLDLQQNFQNFDSVLMYISPGFVLFFMIYTAIGIFLIKKQEIQAKVAQNILKKEHQYIENNSSKFNLQNDSQSNINAHRDSTINNNNEISIQTLNNSQQKIKANRKFRLQQQNKSYSLDKTTQATEKQKNKFDITNDRDSNKPFSSSNDQSHINRDIQSESNTNSNNPLNQSEQINLN